MQIVRSWIWLDDAAKMPNFLAHPVCLAISHHYRADL
jgi:hypothetical protein